MSYGCMVRGSRCKRGWHEVESVLVSFCNWEPFWSDEMRVAVEGKGENEAVRYEIRSKY